MPQKEGSLFYCVAAPSVLPYAIQEYLYLYKHFFPVMIPFFKSPDDIIPVWSYVRIRVFRDFDTSWLTNSVFSDHLIKSYFYNPPHIILYKIGHIGVIL